MLVRKFRPPYHTKWLNFSEDRRWKMTDRITEEHLPILKRSRIFSRTILKDLASSNVLYAKTMIPSLSSVPIKFIWNGRQFSKSAMEQFIFNPSYGLRIYSSRHFQMSYKCVRLIWTWAFSYHYASRRKNFTGYVFCAIADMMRIPNESTPVEPDICCWKISLFSAEGVQIYFSMLSKDR